MAGRETGIVKWFDSSEGYGYIARKKGEDIYVHYTAVLCESGDCDLKEGDVVEFTVFYGNNGPQAQDVIILR